MPFGLGFGSTGGSGGGGGTTTIYTVTVPIVATYPAGTIFNVVIAGVQYSITLTSASTPAQVAVLLTALRQGTWTVATVGSNNVFTFVPTGSSVLSTMTIITSEAWTVQAVPVSANTDLLTSICFVDKNNGWACGYGTTGQILNTTNGGATWTVQYTNINVITAVYFTDALHGWFTLANGSVGYTINGGSSWTIVSIDVTQVYWNIFFINSNVGWIVGNSGSNQIMKTINGGLTWTPQTNPVGSALFSIYFSDINNGWSVGTTEE